MQCTQCHSPAQAFHVFSPTPAAVQKCHIFSFHPPLASNEPDLKRLIRTTSFCLYMYFFKWYSHTYYHYFYYYYLASLVKGFKIWESTGKDQKNSGSGRCKCQTETRPKTQANKQKIYIEKWWSTTCIYKNIQTTFATEIYNITKQQTTALYTRIQYISIFACKATHKKAETL